MNASRPILTLMVKLLKVNAQHVPHPGELNPVTAEAPPMLGKLGKLPNVVKFFVKSPLDPVEHSTVLSDWFKLSYIGSKETRTARTEAAKTRSEDTGNIIDIRNK